jgi:hypothetical protein
MSGIKKARPAKPTANVAVFHEAPKVRSVLPPSDSPSRLACFFLNKKPDRRRLNGRMGYDSDNNHQQSIPTES